MKVAIVHDWLVTYAGAERVLGQILRCYPEADVFSLIDFLPASERDFLQGKSVETSWVQKLPMARRHYRYYLLAMTLAVEQFDFSRYDLVISSSHAVAKGILTGPYQLHLSYVHSPIRYAWDLQHQYLKESGLDRGLKSYFVRWLLHWMRIWDLRTANSVDHFMANSQFIARRIQKVYGREATVIYPPVDIGAFTLQTAKEDFYLSASRFVPYKKIDLIAEAFATMPHRRLVLIGDGPDFQKVEKKAPPNVVLLGYQNGEALRDHMRRAKAFLFAAEEDFGITPLEAQACGTPVIAFGRGGVLESVRGLETPQPTGVFFKEQTVESIRDAVDRFEARQAEILPIHCRVNAERFGDERFRREFRGFVEEKLAAFHRGKALLG